MSRPRHRVPVEGLIAHWFSLNDVAKLGTWYDRSGNGHNGTLYADAQVTGREGCAFDGTGDYVGCGNLTELNSATAATIAFWARKGANTYDCAIGSYSASQYSAFMQWYQQTVYAFFGSGAYGYCSAAWVDAATWKHILAVYDGSQTGNSGRLKLYLDGVAQTLTFSGTVPSSLPASTGTAFNIGRYSTGYTWYYSNGTIDGIGVWSRAFSAGEVERLYRRTMKR